MLRLKFKKLHDTVASNVNPAIIVDFLLKEGVIGHDDMRRLVDWLEFSMTAFSAHTGWLYHTMNKLK